MAEQDRTGWLSRTGQDRMAERTCDKKQKASHLVVLGLESQDLLRRILSILATGFCGVVRRRTEDGWRRRMGDGWRRRRGDGWSRSLSLGFSFSLALAPLGSLDVCVTFGEYTLINGSGNRRDEVLAEAAAAEDLPEVELVALHRRNRIGASKSLASNPSYTRHRASAITSTQSSYTIEQGQGKGSPTLLTKFRPRNADCATSQSTSGTRSASSHSIVAMQKARRRSEQLAPYRWP
jgi:hypothetical protein